MIIIGDSLIELSFIKNDSIDLIITSPPYKNSDGFSYQFTENIFKQLYRVQTPNILFFLNLGGLEEDKMVPFLFFQKEIIVGYK